MFQQDTAEIRRFVGIGSHEWENRAASVALAVAFTIRTRTATVTAQLADFSSGSGSYVYMGRRLTYDAIRDGEHIDIFRRVRAAMDVGDIAGSLLAMADMPGLGLVKSGFVLQMIWQVAGCLDSRNVQQFGLSIGQYNLTKSPLSPAVKRERAYRYIAECDLLGGTEYLWNNWCLGVAATSSHYQSAEEVSREHVAWVRLANKGLWGYN